MACLEDYMMSNKLGILVYLLIFFHISIVFGIVALAGFLNVPLP